MDWVYVIFATLQVFQHGLSYECDSNPTCEIWLSVEEKLTMTWGKIRVYAKNSHLYRFDEDWRNATSKVTFIFFITLEQSDEDKSKVVLWQINAIYLMQHNKDDRN